MALGTQSATIGGAAKTLIVALDSNGNVAAAHVIVGADGVEKGTQANPLYTSTAIASGTVTVSNLPSVLPVSIATLPLPTGAATAAAQPALHSDGGSLAHITNFPPSQAITATALPLPTGAATAASQPSLHTDGGSLAHITNFPLSQAVTLAALPSLAAGSNQIGAVTQAGGPWSVSWSGQSVAASQSGTWTVGLATGSTVTLGAGSAAIGSVSVSGAVAVTGAFYQATQPISAVALPLPANAAQDGTDATGITPPTGGVGIRGWLSGSYQRLSQIYTAITGTLTVTDPAAEAALGAPGDAAWTSGSGSIVALGKAFVAAIKGTLTATLATGSNVIGSVNVLGGNATAVKVDGSAVTQPVSFPSLPAGGNAIGTVGINSSALGGIAAPLATYGAMLPLVRDGFNGFNTSTLWTVNANTASEIVEIDGNANGASYLKIVKDPRVAGSLVDIIGQISISIPFRHTSGVSLSQRIAAQDFTAEFVGLTPNTTTIDSTALPAAVTISSLSQSTNTLTINTATAHGCVAGDRFDLYGCVDPRLNYSSLLVATTPTNTQITVTASTYGALPSVTVSPSGTATMQVTGYSSGSNNTCGFLIDGTSANNAIMYRARNGGEQKTAATALNTGWSTALVPSSPVQFNTSGSYAFQSTANLDIRLSTDLIQGGTILNDSSGAGTFPTNFFFTDNIPTQNEAYIPRFRALNRVSMPVPICKIVSISKTGTAVATVTTDVAHGLSTADYVYIFGVQNQTNFANTGNTATAVASVVDATHFTISFGAAVTAASNGGAVFRAQGSNATASLSVVAQSASASGGLLTVVGSATWTGLTPGEHVCIHGAFDTTGTAVPNLDAIFKVFGVSGTSLLLVPARRTAAAITDFTSVSCGASVIKCTDYRLHLFQLLDYSRALVEVDPGINRGQAANSMPVSIAGGTLPTVSTVSTVSTVNAVTTVGTVTAANLAIPLLVADQASAAITATTTSSTITPSAGTSYSVDIAVTAVSGTSPAMDVQIQESDDAGTNWVAIYDFERITTTGMYRSPPLPLRGNRVRYVQTISGTSPSFTRSINRLQSSWNGTTAISQKFDRSLVTTTAGSTTGFLYTDGAKRLSIVVSLAAGGSAAPIFQVQGSEDGTKVYSIGATLTGIIGGLAFLTIPDVSPKYTRVIVATAGTGTTLDFVQIKAF